MAQEQFGSSDIIQDSNSLFDNCDLWNLKRVFTFCSEGNTSVFVVGSTGEGVEPLQGF